MARFEGLEVEGLEVEGLKVGSGKVKSNWRASTPCSAACTKLMTCILLKSMAPLPSHRPKQLSLGSLEAEVLEILWTLGSATVKEVHDRILADPNRELAYTSVTTVLRRLAQKGWISCDRQEKAFQWRPLVSQQEANILKAHDQLQQFLAVGNPDVVAAFADSLDRASLDQLDAIAQRLQAVRKAREEQ